MIVPSMVMIANKKIPWMVILVRMEMGWTIDHQHRESRPRRGREESSFQKLRHMSWKEGFDNNDTCQLQKENTWRASFVWHRHRWRFGSRITGTRRREPDMRKGWKWIHSLLLDELQFLSLSGMENHARLDPCQVRERQGMDIIPTSLQCPRSTWILSCLLPMVISSILSILGGDYSLPSIIATSRIQLIPIGTFQSWLDWYF